MARLRPADRLLTTAEAATRLGVTPAYVAALARQGAFGLKDDAGRWIIRASEVRAYKRRRQRADPFALPWRRAVPAPREPRAPRLSRADQVAMTLLDDLVARERAIEQQYDLPFRAPQQVGLTAHPCQICHRTCCCSSSPTTPATKPVWLPTADWWRSQSGRTACPPTPWPRWS